MSRKFDLNNAIRKIPDYPKKGILFFDITSILTDPEAFRFCIDRMVEIYKDHDITAVAGIESRGFIFAAPFADRMGIPLILVRKAGKTSRGNVASGLHPRIWQSGCGNS